MLRCYLWHLALLLLSPLVSLSLWHSALHNIVDNLACSEDQEMGEDELA